MNISGIVVQTRPEYLDGVVESLQSDPALCDYHFHDELGRIVVTIEGEGIDEEMKKLVRIQQIPHVIAADMQFSYTEEELEAERDKLEREGTALPSWLEAEDVDAKEIVYHGDLRKKAI